jgi:hypothetical protein
VVRDGVWPFLKERGFKRTKASFHRPVEDNWEVVNLQKSAYSDRESVTFTVNLAVGLGRLREGARDWADGKRPAENRCHLRERLGLMLTGDDVWWTVDEATDHRALADTINTALERYGLPWLAARSSDKAIADLLGSPERLGAERDHHVHWLQRYAGGTGG